MIRTTIATLALGTALAAAAPASAAVVITSTQIGSAASYAAPANSSTVINFNGASLTSEATSKGFTATTGGDGGIVTGSPTINGTFYLRPEPSDNTAYYGIGRTPSFLQLLGTTAQSGLSVFIGSIDGYNLVELLGSAGQRIGQFNGTDILGFTPDFPGTTDPNTNRRVNFGTTDGTLIYGVRFSNTNNLSAMEIDNVAFTAAVPEPTTWAMMVLGFGVIGFGMRRRKSVKTTVQFA